MASLFDFSKEPSVLVAPVQRAYKLTKTGTVRVSPGSSCDELGVTFEEEGPVIGKKTSGTAELE
jgi:hypothetical protein